MTIDSLNSVAATARAVETAEQNEMEPWIFAIALACGVWYFFILLVQGIGFTQLYVHIYTMPTRGRSSS